MSANKQTIAPRIAAIIAVSIAFALMSGCSDKADKADKAADDVAAIRAMMEKKEADQVSAHEKDFARSREIAAQRKASR